MIGGAYASVSTSDNDESFLNLACRFNGGQPYYGNILVEWHFYDNGLADYSDLTGATSPYTNSVPLAAQRFFRLRN